MIMNQSFDGLSDKECLMYGIDDQSQLTCLYSMHKIMHIFFRLVIIKTPALILLFPLATINPR